MNRGNKSNKDLWEADPFDKNKVRVGPGVVEPPDYMNSASKLFL